MNEIDNNVPFYYKHIDELVANFNKKENSPPKEADSIFFSAKEFIIQNLFNPEITLNAKFEHLNLKDTRIAELLGNLSLSFKDDGIVEGVVSFNQDDMINSQLPDTLKGFVFRFQGLCELICNKVLIEDLLGKEGSINQLKQKITPEELNKDSITKSHMLDVYSIFHKMAAFLFGVYPDNIFSVLDQWKLVEDTGNEKKINREVLADGLKHLENGTILKLEVFSKDQLSFTGHSLLVKKVNENEFIFFDPNSGEHRGLSMDELSNKIDEQLQNFEGTDLFFTKGDDYLKRLKAGKIVTTATQILNPRQVQ